MSCNSSTSTPSNPFKTPRRASRLALKKSIITSQTRASRATISSSSFAPSRPALRPQKLLGELPPFNDWTELVEDEEGHTIYFYGGCRQGDGSLAPTSDFYCLDLQTLQIKNLTNALRYRRPQDPFCQIERTKLLQPLPALQNPAAAFLSLNSGNFLFLFGGYSSEQGKVTSDMIVVDLNSNEWWTVVLRGGPVNGRTCANMVGIDNRLYIFGGKNAYGQSAKSFASYCIAEYSADMGAWSWIACDQPYPQDLPALGYSGGAHPVYGGKKIFLTAGRPDGDDQLKIHLSKDNCVFFHTQNRTFSIAAETTGNFPPQMLWYNACHLAPPPPTAPSASPTDIPNVNHRNRLPKARTTKTITPARPLATTSSGSIASPSIIICGWTPHHDGTAIPDFWRYYLPPEETVTCLNLRDKVWDLNIDLRGFVSVGRRAFLLGYEDPSLEPDTESDTTPTHAVWNTCVEIPLD